MPHVVSVRVDRWPRQIAWVHADGSVLTTDHDLSTRDGIEAVALRAELLGLGPRAETIELLTGLGDEFSGPILPRDGAAGCDGLPDEPF